MEVLEQKTELSNIELLTSNDTKSDLSEIDMPDSKDSKVTPVLNNTDVTDKQLMESQLQNASNCEIQQKSEVLEQKISHYYRYYSLNLLIYFLTLQIHPVQELSFLGSVNLSEIDQRVLLRHQV
jgi:hypothetical protein